MENLYGQNFGPRKNLIKTKASIPVNNWNAQYMQQPTAEEGAILKRDWWHELGLIKNLHLVVSFIIQSLMIQLF